MSKICAQRWPAVCNTLQTGLTVLTGSMWRIPCLTTCGRPLTFQELPLAPLLTLAGLLERLRIPASFTRFGLAAVTQGCVLDLKKTTRTLDFQPQRDFWEALPELCAWVGRPLEGERRICPGGRWRRMGVHFR